MGDYLWILDRQEMVYLELNRDGKLTHWCQLEPSQSKFWKICWNIEVPNVPQEVDKVIEVCSVELLGRVNIDYLIDLEVQLGGVVVLGYPGTEHDDRQKVEGKHEPALESLLDDDIPDDVV